MAEMEEVELTGRRLFDFNGLKPTICGFDGIKDCILKFNVDGSPAENLRRGDWFFDYMIGRNSLLKLDVPSFDNLLIYT